MTLLKMTGLVTLALLGTLLGLLLLLFYYYRPTLEYEGSGGIRVVSVGLPELLIVLAVMALILFGMFRAWKLLRAWLR
jgi:hypothetical protein